MSLREKIEQAQSGLADPVALHATLDRLVADGEISAEGAARLRDALPDELRTTGYVLRQLGAHVGIGVVFAFDLVPLPLGTIARVAWVAGNRVLEGVRGNRARARIHSLGVLAIAAIPWFGYAAYLLPLRRQSPQLAFVLANHTWLARTDQSYERFLANARPSVRRVGRWLVPASGILASDPPGEPRGARASPWDGRNGRARRCTMQAASTLLFLVASAVKLAPVAGLFVPSLIPGSYGVELGDPDLLILLRHRAGLFAIVGGLLGAAAFRAELRPVATLAGLFSMLSFVGIVWLDGPANAQLTRYAVIDAVAAVALLGGYALDRRQRRSVAAD